MVPKTERFEMRMDEDVLERVDQWRSQDGRELTRSEAVRQLIEAGLGRAGAETIHLSDGDKLIILMLRDIYKHLKVKDADMDPDFLADVIHGGHYWAPAWSLGGIFHGHEDDPRVLKEAVAILEMWDWIEWSYGKLSKKDKDLIEREAEPFGKHVKFPGFDGNNEGAYLGVATFLVNKLERFSIFEGRDLNSHIPLLPNYRQMLPLYMAHRERSATAVFGSAQIIALLKAMQR